ncbi:hypothetical protein F5X99DRAFT_411137 [Biscogniauxia marginata]|nr:hypothetical protein F5X99DRAFT_411137 [Biscogniauxia marginata]
MKFFVGILFAIILALCPGLASGTISQNGTVTSSEGPILVTRSIYPSAATVTKPPYTSYSFTTILGNSDPTSKSIATKIAGEKVPAQPTKNREDLCGFLFGHRCGGINLRRPHQGQVRGIDGHPLSTAWFESITINTSLPLASMDSKPAINSRVSNNVHPILSLGSGLSAETNQQLSTRGRNIATAPSISGAYGDYEPDVPSGEYGYPPNPTNRPTITPPVVITTPVIVQTLFETVTLSLSYIPSSSLSTPLTSSPLVNSTPTFPNTTIPETLMSENTPTPKTDEYTPSTRTESVISTRSSTLVTPSWSSSNTYTGPTTWSFESILHTVTPTPTPAIETNSARTTSEANYPLLCFMLALALAGSTAYDVRVSSTIESSEGPVNRLQRTENNDELGHDRSCYVKGFGDEEADTQSKIEDFFAQYGRFDVVYLRRVISPGRRGRRPFKGSVFVKWEDKNTATEFINLMPKPEYNGNPLVIKWMLDYKREKAEAIINHQIFMSRMRRQNRFDM